MHILISSAGRRVGLLRCFRDSLRRLGVAGRIVAADASLQAPALHFADSFFSTPRCDDPAFVPRLMDIAARERIDLIVPTIDPELAVYARARPLLAAQRTAVAISSAEAVAICADKQQTHRWLRRHGFPTPAQQDLAEALANPIAGFPRIAKPRHGSGSVGVRRVGSYEELRALASQLEEPDSRAFRDRQPLTEIRRQIVGATGRETGRETGGQTAGLGEYVVEEIASGEEHTINVFVDAAGVCRSAVPHRRIEVRAGEVSKAVTVRHAGLIDVARRIAEALPGGRGPLSIQCFLAPDGSLRVTEINARFGGGYPLTHRAGARFTDWMLEELLAVPSSAANDWTDNLTMLRYDREVFVSGDSQPTRMSTRMSTRKPTRVPTRVPAGMEDRPRPAPMLIA
ncbi:MAG: ATP-grasp domain-containing protein [Bryobacterales bacterium]